MKKFKNPEAKLERGRDDAGRSGWNDGSCLRCVLEIGPDG